MVKLESHTLYLYNNSYVTNTIIYPTFYLLEDNEIH